MDKHTVSRLNRELLENLKLDKSGVIIIIIRKQYSVYGKNLTSILVSTIITIFIILSTIQITCAFTFNNIYPTKLHPSDAQKSIAPFGINMGRIILYSIVIAIVIVHQTQMD